MPVLATDADVHTVRRLAKASQQSLQTKRKSEKKKFGRTPCLLLYVKQKLHGRKVARIFRSSVKLRYLITQNQVTNISLLPHSFERRPFCF